jgi:hypothetical protein
VLVRAAAARRLAKSDHAVLCTLCDFPFYRALVAAGLDRPAAERRIIALVTAIEENRR